MKLSGNRDGATIWEGIFRMTHDVFISYASEDKITADATCATLEANQIRCWHGTS